MDSQNTSTENAVQTLLERTAAMQASIDAIVVSLAILRDGQMALQGAVTALQVDVAGVKGRMAHYATRIEVEQIHAELGKLEHYATKTDVERLRSELYKALETQTWRLLIWMTAVSSGLVSAVYYIARNVH